VNFRYARHTSNLKSIIRFYTENLGLEILGEFKDHSGYDGVFLGKKDLGWQLEFTRSKDKPIHSFDEDDALVFYLNTDIELSNIIDKLKSAGKPELQPKNSYWKVNGRIFSDPDGHHIILSVKSITLTTQKGLSKEFKKLGISDWNKLLNYVKSLPYGRNADRGDFDLVIKEKKGTCSSKHALIKKMADLNSIPDIKLILAIYRMNETNTPGIGKELPQYKLSYLPEAHCFLKIGKQRVDLTRSNADIKFIEQDIIEEMEIQPEQVVEFKVVHHKKFISEWIKTNNLDLSFEQVWKLRENCIANLEQNNKL
jgi:hypothetical protein